MEKYTKNQEFLDFSEMFALKLFSKKEIHELFLRTKLLFLEKDEYLIKEGDEANSFFIIIEGDCLIQKKDPLSNLEIDIGHVKHNEIIGEMGLFENNKREASIICQKKSKIYQITYKDFFDLAKKNPIYYKIFMNMTQVLTSRIQKGNLKIIEHMKHTLKEAAFKNKMANFFVFVICWLCVFSFILKNLITLTSSSQSSSLSSFTLLLLCTIFVLSALRSLKMPLMIFGLNLTNWRKSVKESLLFSLPILFLIVILKIVLVYSFASFKNNSIFDLWTVWKPSILFSFHLDSLSVWILTLLFYSLLITFLQEFLARGVLQTLLNQFLTNKHKSAYSNLIANLIFSVHHLHISYTLAMLVLFPGIYFGWIFSRHKTLLGCYLAHAIIGSFALFFVGLKAAP